MCGIAGYINLGATDVHSCLEEAVKALNKRGPDNQNAVKLSNNIGFAHARLSIIDTSACGNQPMYDASGRYALIFNGEIFNFHQLREQFLGDVQFASTSDTEVLLNMYIKLGKDCLQHLNGFFAFAIFDAVKKEVFIARDRYGIKPLHVYADKEMIVFASELKAIFKFPVKKEIDYNTLALYMQLNYIPGSYSMIKHVQKLKPGCFMAINSTGAIEQGTYYTIPYTPGKVIDKDKFNYDEAKNTLNKLVEESVQRRLVSDVPLGTFLSGGIDSSIVTACAVKHVSNLNTFSIGYKDEPYFDETKYANLVAAKFKTNHTVFSISNEEMYNHIYDILDYIDEPFADSSAIAVYILCQKTRQKVTVALSGDGGDELFAGYNKHKAEMQAQDTRLVNTLLKAGLPAFKLLPQSRHTKYGNVFRQVNRYAEGLQLSRSERYWRWCVINAENTALSLLKNKGQVNEAELEQRKQTFLDVIKESGDLNDVLMADTKMVLPGDMLTKVDLMSMANSLEVRVPLLDYNVVNYAFSLPLAFKTQGGEMKRILKDAFRNELPAELFSRPKHGFEVPLLKWMRTGLRSLIEDDLLSKKFVDEQGIFDSNKTEELKKQLFSNNPADTHATVWGLLVFQYWFKKYFSAHA